MARLSIVSQCYVMLKLIQTSCKSGVNLICRNIIQVTADVEKENNMCNKGN